MVSWETATSKLLFLWQEWTRSSGVIINLRLFYGSWYCLYPISYRNLEEMMCEQVEVDHALFKAINELKVKRVGGRCGITAEQVSEESSWVRPSIYQAINQSKYGIGSFNTARRTIKGYEIMNMIRKGQILGVGKGATERVKSSLQFFERGVFNSFCNTTHIWLKMRRATCHACDER